MSPALALALALVGVPTVVAMACWTTCGAVTRTTASRCRNPRPGPFHRCQHHGGTPFVRSDAHGLMAAGVALLGFLAWHALYPGPVDPRLIPGILPATAPHKR